MLTHIPNESYRSEGIGVALRYSKQCVGRIVVDVKKRERKKEYIRTFEHVYEIIVGREDAFCE